MNTFIEENKKLLRNCYVWANVVGWFLLVLGCWSIVGVFIELWTRLGDWGVFKEYWLASAPWGNFNGAPLGLLALGIGQFTKFIYDEDYKPGMVLRNADKLIYIYIVLFVLSLIIRFITGFPHWEYWWVHRVELIISVLSHIFTGVGITMLLIAVALILKRVMPVIEESRTLV